MTAFSSQSDVSQYHVASTARESSSVSRSLLAHVSIIIPIGPDDLAWRLLVSDLADSGLDADLLLIGTYAEPADLHQLRGRGGSFRRMRWITTNVGRAHQMNDGARLSTGSFLWFLHADSRVGADALVALERSLEAYPHGLHYFDLAFQDDGPRRVRLNALGAHIRSRYLGLPFGDQGLCMSRDTFQWLGGFNERVAYGEDHLLIWAAHRRRVQLHRVAAHVSTSARKYRTEGWLTTTVKHGWRTWRQAIPEFCRLLWSRIR